MPSFVSRFSPSRIAGANFQGLRARVDGQEGRGRIGASNRERRTESRDREGGFLERIRGRGEREELLVRNQLGELIRSRLQETDQRGAGISGEDENDGVQRTETRPRRGTPPGVGTVRTRADDDIDRPGRLGREPANPAIQRQLDRFARLRSAASGGSTQPRQEARNAERLTGLLGI